MDFRLGEASEALRAEVEAFLSEAMTPALEEQMDATGVSYDEAFTAGLVERRWMVPAWAEEDGGLGLHPMVQVALDEALTRADAPLIGPSLAAMVANAVRRSGSDDLKAEVLPGLLSGEVVVALGFSEPEAGSDVANVQCRAARHGDEWLVNGQKMFTTNGHIADYAFLLARTDPTSLAHRGLTMFLVPMKQPAVEAQAVYTLSGERTNITYYADARVPDRLRVGPVDGGWGVLMGALQDEHSTGYAGHTVRLLDHVEAWARDTGRVDDGAARARMAKAATEIEVSLLLQRRAAWMETVGEVPEAEGPMAKLFSTESMERAAQDLVEMVGPDALRRYLDPTAPQRGRIEHGLRFSIGTTIYAGTSEIQRNIIAQRGLGLPR